MTAEFRLPELGEGIETAEVASVLVKPGDRVAKGQNLLEVETDKAVIEIPSPQAGVVAAVHCKPGDKLPPGFVLVTFAEGAGAVAAVQPVLIAAEPEQPTVATANPAATPEPAPAPTPLPAPTSPAAPLSSRAPRVSAGPATRLLARELGVDLGMVGGTGPRGRVTPEEVKAYVKRRLESSPAAGPIGSPPQLPDFSKWGPIQFEPLRSVRKVTAARMAVAWSQAPRVTQFDKADLTHVELLRDQFGPEVAERGGKLTVTVFALKACAAALKQFPEFNCSLDLANNRLVRKEYCHIGVAVDTPRGLLVPVIRDVDQKSVVQLASELADLSARARDGKVAPDEMQGGCFTLTKLGGLGGTAFTPIVNFPEVAILGLACTQPELALSDGQVVSRPMLPLCLSYDHRVIDGADAARFARHLAELLEQPGRLLLIG